MVYGNDLHTLLRALQRMPGDRRAWLVTNVLALLLALVLAVALAGYLFR